MEMARSTSTSLSIPFQAARMKANLFNGSEDPSSLIDLQAETLLLFDK